MAYPKVQEDTTRNAGTVHARTVTTLVVDVEARMPGYGFAEDVDEIVLRLNGRPLKRMTRHQAIRAGVIGEDR